MVNLFNEAAFAEILTQIEKLDYRDKLLRKRYGFSDWFSRGVKREIDAAAFAYTPASYETALIGVVSSNGSQGSDLVDDFRGLGAPVILEVTGNEVREWIVSPNKGKHALVQRVSFDHIRQFFVDRTAFWKPHDLIRYKNIGTLPWVEQPDLFAGLVPELEEHIQEKLKPLLSRAMAETLAEYKRTANREPRPDKLFKLVFSVLTAKVFADRKVNGFTSLSANSGDVLTLLSRRYDDAELPKLLNRFARDAAVSNIWSVCDFRNLSVEALAQMWSSMLIDRETRRKLGIHRTSRTIVRYIVEKIEFRYPGDQKRIIFEPCTGSAAFLIGAMNRLRPTLFGMTPTERHSYFTKRLVGIESDPFGVEISKLALTLADFPNPGGWKIDRGDVFAKGALTDYLGSAGVVLCNPPFRDFDPDERPLYDLSSTHKPVELLQRILKDLHPGAVLGFVLPRAFADGSYYKQIRAELAERFANVDVTILPDKAFDADTEPALLVATEPFPHNTTKMFFSRVRDSNADWKLFESLHRVVSYSPRDVTPSVAADKFFVPDLADVWEYLESHQTLTDVARLYRGLQWKLPLTKDGVETGNRQKLIKDAPPDDTFRLGVPPLAKFSIFQTPNLAYLSHRPEHQLTNQYRRPWDKPKAILNKSTRSRGRWRIAAFPDSEGLSAYQTFTGVWPTNDDWDEVLIAATLNAPLANAFVSSWEGKTDITIDTLEKIPIPTFTAQQAKKIRDLVSKYQRASAGTGLFAKTTDDPERLLLEIDALVLDGYGLPPRLEHQILMYFQGHSSERRVSHDFGDYLPDGYESYFSLSTHISPQFKQATAGALRERSGIS